MTDRIHAHAHADNTAPDVGLSQAAPTDLIAIILNSSGLHEKLNALTASDVQIWMPNGVVLSGTEGVDE